MIIYIFGQPGSGKTTLAQKLADRFYDNRPIHFNGYCVIDGDVMRQVFKDQDYSKAGRVRNIQRAMDIALYQSYHYNKVICSLVTPYNFQRIWLQQQRNDVLFVYLTYNTNDIRGRESFHVKDFEPPTGLNNMCLLNTSDLDEDTCISFILEHVDNMENKLLTKKD